MCTAEAPAGIGQAGRRPAARGPLLLAAAAAATLGVFLVLPYYVNGLDRFPLAEVAGGLHDPKDLWPFDLAVLGGLLRLCAFAAMVVGPLMATLAAGWAVVETWRARALPERRRTAVSGLLALVIAALTWVWCASATGEALFAWMLD